MSLNVLLITGGQHHDFDRVAASLAATLKSAGMQVHAARDGAGIASGKFEVVLLFTQGDQLDAGAVDYLAKFVRNGGGLVALHSSNASIKNETLARLIGSRFKTHGKPFDYTVSVSDPDHPIAHRVQSFRVHDELYFIEKAADFQTFLTTSIDNEKLPLGYTRVEGKGKVVYLANGHTIAVLEHPTFRQLLLRSVRYAAGEDWMNKTVNVAAIGYGGAFNMGKLHLESCNKAKMKAVAVCDVDEKRTATAKADFGQHMRTFSRVDDLLEKSDAELCIIITPHNTHAPLAIQCLQSGRHIVTEKPFTISIDEATSVIEAARKAGKMATVFHNRRWDGDFLTIRNLVESGAIGDVYKIECFWGNFAEPKADWWRSRKDITGGALHDWGAHFTDWVLQLMPYKIESVSGFFEKKVWPQTTIEDHAEAVVRFEGGRIAQLETSAMAAVGKQRFRILGTRGAIEQRGWDAKDGIHVVTYKDGQLIDSTVPCQKSDWDGFYRNVADHLILGEELIVKPEEARKVIAVVDLAEQSSKQGGRPLPLPFEQ